MNTVLVTAIGSVAGDIVIKTLKQYGHRVVGCDIYPKSYVVDAGNVDCFYQVPYTSAGEEYLHAIHEICEREKVSFVFPMTDLDVDLFNNSRDWFVQHGICLCISPEHALKIARDKKALSEFIQRGRFKVRAIPTLMVKEVSDLPWPFPIVCKPNNGRSSQGLRYIYSELEWNSFIVGDNVENYIVEPYISGPVVVADIVRHPKSRESAVVLRKELIATPHGCGITVEMFHDEAFEAAILELADALDVYGCVNFECKLDEQGAYHVIECNPRFSAGTEFSCMTGFNCVYNHLRCFESDHIEKQNSYQNMIIARKYEEYITSVTEGNEH